MIESPHYNKCCLICKRSDRVFSVSYRSGVYSVKDDIAEFMGPKVECMLNDDDVVCNNCMNIFYNIANLKRKIYFIICQQTDCKKDEKDSKFDNKTFKFSNIWESFISNINLSIPHDCESQIPSQDLWVPRYSIPVIEDTSSRLNYRSDTPYVDKEVENVLKKKQKKRRKRGKRILFTHRKASRRSKSAGAFPPSRASSFYQSDGLSLYSERCQSETSRPTSASSYQSLVRPQSRLSTGSDFDDGLRYENGCLRNKRTRSVSRAQDEHVNRLALIEIYTCSEPPCDSVLFPTLEYLTDHKINVHNSMALYYCDECKSKYTTEEDLRKHNILHHSYLPTNCPCCSELQANTFELQAHLQEHLLHSVPCIYCDKTFLTRRKCDDHVKDIHSGKKKRIRLKRPRSILDRIVKDGFPSDTETPCPEVQNDDENLFIRVRIQNSDNNEKDDSCSCLIHT